MVYPHSYRTEHSETHTTNGVYGEYYEAMQRTKIKIQPELLKMFQYVDSNRALLLDDLAEAIKIRSIGGLLDCRKEVKKMMQFVARWFTKLEIKNETIDSGFYYVDKKKVKLPTVILAEMGHDSRKKTVLVYLHVDVPNPDCEQWRTDPWTLTQVGNRYYGNGAACGKLAMMSWFHVIRGFKTSKLACPVNLKFVVEAMKHENSVGLANFVASRSQDFFANIDVVVECDSEWLGEKHPCVIYGTVGILNYDLSVEKVEGATEDVMNDMKKISDALIDAEGNVLVENFHESVEQITPDEEKIYESIHFDPDEIKDALPENKKSWDKVKLLMSFWRLPSMAIGDMVLSNNAKTNQPVVKRNFVMKLVPRQIVTYIDVLVRNYLNKVVKKEKIENKVNLDLLSSTRCWFENCYTHQYVAAKRAFIQVYKEDPNMIREDRGRETATIFDNVLEKQVIVIPLCPRGSNCGESNENIIARNYYEGTKVIAAFLYQYSYAVTGKFDKPT